MLKWGIGAAATALATAFAGGSASAQMYLSVGAGWQNLDDADTIISNGAGTGSPIRETFVTDEDLRGNVGLGWDFGAIRLEAEGSWGQNSVNQYNTSTPSVLSRHADGSVNTVSAMVNAYYDFDVGGGFTPYLGVGVGFLSAEFEFEGAPPTGAATAPTVTLLDDSATNPTVQVMAGLAIPLSKNMTVTGQYRYFDAGTYGVADTAGHSTEIELKGISWDVGLRFGF